MPDPTLSERPLVVAVVGLGYWGPNLLRVLVDDSSVVVKWICDSDAQRLSRFHRRYPATQPTTEFDRVLADRDVDVVIIATPVFTHFELAAASVSAGKHTFVEKPLARGRLAGALRQGPWPAHAPGLRGCPGSPRPPAPRAPAASRHHARDGRPLPR